MAYTWHRYHRPMMILASLLLVGAVIACGAAATNSPEIRDQTVAQVSLGDATSTPRPSPQSSPTPRPVETTSPGAQPSPTPTSLSTQTPFSTPEATDQPTTAPPQTPEGVVGPVVTVGETVFPVELATTVAEQIQGLSGRPSLAPGSGMLFVYEQESKFNFWMKDMHFPLDIVWIGVDCTVVDITRNAPPPSPDQSTDQLPRYSPGGLAQYVLEINAGEADSESIAPGDPVEFTGSLADRYGC